MVVVTLGDDRMFVGWASVDRFVDADDLFPSHDIRTRLLKSVHIIVACGWMILPISGSVLVVGSKSRFWRISKCRRL